MYLYDADDGRFAWKRKKRRKKRKVKQKKRKRRDPIPSKERFKKWYEKHREEFNEKRRKRYHTDPEYRARAVAYARTYRKRIETPENRLIRLRKQAEARGISYVHRRVAWRASDGRCLYGVSVMKDAAGIPWNDVYKLVNHPDFPEVYYDPITGRKLFMDFQISAIVEGVRKFGPRVRGKAVAEILEYLTDRWEEDYVSEEGRFPEFDIGKKYEKLLARTGGDTSSNTDGVGADDGGDGENTG